MSNTENNKRIAKNTLFMYFRMLLTMVVTLYTSRVILRTLGVEDFGIYNIVGGVVVLFAFINTAMTAGTQRHFSYELGKKDGNMSEIYSACLQIHLFIALIVFLLSETIGLWFLNTQMNFPEGRLFAVNWVYQFSILGCLVNILRVPYQALIIAHERMSFYAYTGIVEVILKLLIVYCLLIISMDKLCVYAVLVFFVISIITLWFILYCKKYFESIRLVRIKDKTLYKKLINFSGWTLLGSVANVGLQQGISVLLNIFYGVAINASVGIANQVNSAIMQFVGGFQQALNPQLVKTEANNDKSRQLKLICESSKLSFYIMFVIAFPIVINLDYILTLWLESYPIYTLEICKMIIIGALIECLSGPLWITIFATGKLKYYQIIISFILLCNIPLSYICGYLHFDPESMFLVRNVLYVVALIARLIFLKKYIDFPIRIFIKDVIIPIIVVLVITSIPFAFIHDKLTPAADIPSLLLQTTLIVLYEMFFIYLFGFNSEEKKYVANLFLHKIKL